MEEFMTLIPNRYILTMDAAFLLILVFIIVSTILLRLKLKRRIISTIERGDKKGARISTGLSDRTLYLFSEYVEKLSKLYGLNLPLLTGLDDIWMRKFKRSPGRKNLKRLLNYAPEKALFDVMRGVIQKPKLKKLFDEWVVESGEFLVLRKIALSGNGRQFDGKKALELFRDEIDSLTEMMNDSLWQCRFFAASILVHKGGDSHLRILYEAMHDSRDEIRKLLIELFNPGDRQLMYGNLKNIFLNDPVYSVRKAAKKRIDRDFTDLYSVDPGKLSTIQKLHLIELLNTDSKVDENIGLDCIREESSELKLYASRYLARTGTLDRLFLEADLGDMNNFNRAFSLLGTAVKFGVTDFLKALEKTDKVEPLLIASRFLKEEGDRSLITNLLAKAAAVYNGSPRDPYVEELYLNSLECACARGNDDALHLVGSELALNSCSGTIQRRIIPLLPERGDWIFIPVLITFLEDPKFQAREELMQTMLRFPPSMYVPELISVIRNDSYGYLIKTSSLQILGRLRDKSGIQYILENLPLLSLDDAAEYAGYLFENTPDFFNERAEFLLSSGDEKIRSRLIAALPREEILFFLEKILSFLSDSSPAVRIASVKAAVASGNSKALDECLPLLHDPLEKVRIESAKTIGRYGRKKGIEQLKDLLFDSSETAGVKKAVLAGLAYGGTEEAFRTLTEKLYENGELIEETINALCSFNNDLFIRKLFQFLVDAPPKVHPHFMKVLHRMGQKAEIIAEKILLEKESPLREYAVEFLDNSGLIETTARKLAHRDPEERYRAAEFLALVGSRKACRYLITAAKDPSKKVRIEVIKAVDRLQSVEGNMILEDLKEDPDRKVRRYTVWALERAAAREIK